MTRTVSKPTISKVPKEDQEQIKLAVWLAKKGIRFFAIPNGGHRNYLEAAKFKRMGVQPGVPDLCIPIASGGHHGLYIELKRQKGGKVSETQQDWLAYLTEAGYFCSVCYGFEAARDVVLHYLSLTPSAA